MKPTFDYTIRFAFSVDNIEKQWDCVASDAREALKQFERFERQEMHRLYAPKPARIINVNIF